MDEGNEVVNQVVQQGKNMAKQAGKELAKTLLKSPYFYLAVAIICLVVGVIGAFMADTDINAGGIGSYYTNTGEYNFSGQEIVAIAKNLHEFIRTNDYAYSCKDNVENGYNNTCTCDGISSFGKNAFILYDNIKCIDCSAFVSWVLNQYLGYDEFPIRRTSHWFGNPDNWKNKGWLKINKNDIEAGDILWRNGHVGIYIGDGKTVEAGCTSAIRAEYSYGSKQSVINDYSFGIRVIKGD